MNNRHRSIAIALTVASMLATGLCADTSQSMTPASSEKTPQQFPALRGTVIETMNVGRYTYLHVKTEDDKVWVAGPKGKVTKGDTVLVPQGIPMKDFNSPTLKRTFDLIYFVSAFRVEGADPEDTGGLPFGHPPIDSAKDGEPASDPAPAAISGDVVETMESGRYTYAGVKTAEGKVWLAAPKFDCEVGDKILAPQGSLMRNFSSETLNRTFAEIHFVPMVNVEGKGMTGVGLPPGHPSISSTPADTTP